MPLAELLLWAAVLLIGVPSAWRNPTAGALVLAFVVSKTIYLITGNRLATEYYAMPDIFVIAVIYAKPNRYPCPRYRSGWHQIACLLLEKSWADRLILCSFPLVWYFYVADLHPYYVWWALWSISVAQLLIAGTEPLFDYLRRRGADAASSPVQPGDMLVAYPGGGYG